METALKTNRASRILGLVKSLDAEQQKVLEFQLQRMVLTEKAKKLENSIEQNSITIEEIVSEVKKVRNAKK